MACGCQAGYVCTAGCADDHEPHMYAAPRNTGLCAAALDFWDCDSGEDGARNGNVARLACGCQAGYVCTAGCADDHEPHMYAAPRNSGMCADALDGWDCAVGAAGV